MAVRDQRAVLAHFDAIYQEGSQGEEIPKDAPSDEGQRNLPVRACLGVDLLMRLCSSAINNTSKSDDLGAALGAAEHRLHWQA